MKLPRFFRKSIPVSTVIMVIAMVAWMFSGAAQSSLLSTALGVVFGASVIFFIVSLIGILVVRDIENALLRRFGESATAEILAIISANESVNRTGVYRLKLNVHPASGGPFIGVAEDAIRIVNMVNVGDTVSVKYDPRTREVALANRLDKTTWKSEDF